MKSYVTFALLHDLVDVAVQHSDRAEALQVRQRLRTILRAPAPLRVHGPERYVCIHYDRRTVRVSLQIGFQPLELISAEISQSAGFEIYHIYQPDEVYPFVVIAVPTCSLGPF